ncbi:protein-glucosylgalactosylhydroxylysine glucosidase isoform X4 [Pongo abelii]|uniref:protein-glucosylgalactosylhydroxylysine glucosidase isoform X4 n=1 Tax=Pongo abelii TaxID=9601 RepID=UPI0030042ED1
MEDTGEDPTTFAAHSLPSDPRLLATVTSAYLGTRVFHDTLHVSGVYNGAGGDTHRAMLPSPLNVRLEAPAGMGEQLTETFALDTNTGSFLHTLEGPRFRASQCIYAHRTLPHVLAFRVSIARLAPGSGPITLLLRSTFSPESPDLDLHQGPDFQGARYLYGHTLTPEQPGGPQQEVHMLWTPAPPDLTLGEGEEDRMWDFLMAVGGSQAEAQACLTEALQLQARGALYTAHAQAWAQLWAECGLDVVGPLPLRQALRGSLYYLLSALPQPKAPGYICHGLSPGGLSNGSREECYWGHVFWDQDLWMFPNILMFHPEAARAILEYRIRTLGGALENAQNLGYQGAKFAWESAGSGLEVCPEDIYGAQEVHVNGAVVLAFELYYHTTQESCPPTSTIQGSTTLCTQTSWSRTACALLLPWPRTWVCPSPASGWRWLTRSRYPLTWSRTSTRSSMGMSLVWTENADGSGAVNFLTGMGGFLQAVVFGCTGFRVTRAGVTFDPVCLSGISRVSVSGIFYQGNKLNFSFSEDSVTVEVTARAGPWAPHLEAELWPSQARLSLLPGHKVSFPRSAGRIQRSPPKLPGSSSSEFPGRTF